VRLSSPEYDWEKHDTPLINEGPEVLWHGAQLFLIYSASGIGLSRTRCIVSNTSLLQA
jgi:GH43 family beta-xylosidase